MLSKDMLELDSGISRLALFFMTQFLLDVHFAYASTINPDTIKPSSSLIRLIASNCESVVVLFVSFVLAVLIVVKVMKTIMYVDGDSFWIKSPMPVLKISNLGKIEGMSESFTTTTGYGYADVDILNEKMIISDHGLLNKKLDSADVQLSPNNDGVKNLRIECGNGKILFFATSCYKYRDYSLLYLHDEICRSARQTSLDKSRGLIEELIDGSATLICFKDSDGRYELVNRKWEEVTRLRREDIIGKTDEELFPGEIGRAFRINDIKVLETGNALETEEFLEDESGRRYFLSVKFPLLGHDDESKKLCGVFIEITDRKNFENEIIAGRNHFESMVGSFPGLIYRCLFDQQWTMIYMSRDKNNLIGYDTSDFINNSVLSYASIIYPEDRENVYHVVSESAENARPWAMEYRIVHKDGRIRWVLEEGWAVRSEKGDIEYLDGFVSDITDRKMAEDAIVRNEERYKTIITVSNTGAWEYHVDQEYVWCSREYFLILGRNPEHYIMDGRPNLQEVWVELLHPDDIGKATHTFSEYLQNGSQGMYESIFRMKHISGSWVWIWSRGQSLRNEDGSISSVIVGTHINVTDIRIANQTIYEKNKELEQIVYIASHDLRSPLVNVDGYSRELEYALLELKKHIAEGPGCSNDNAISTEIIPEMEDSLRHIRNSAMQMDSLLKGLLKLSRSGRAALNIRILDMNRVMYEVISSHSFQISACNAEVRVDNLPPCHGDDVQITQVFSNLVSNSLKYYDHGRPLVIRIGGTVDSGKSIYSVEDNGIGIALQHQERIFELFHRLDPNETDGEGLGLTIVRQILGRLDGSIRVESTPGLGCVFYVTLPYAEVEDGNNESER